MHCYRTTGVTCSLLLASFLSPALTFADQCTPTLQHRPVCPQYATIDAASFIDPTVSIVYADKMRLGIHSYIAPFTSINADEGISIGEASDVQDNVSLTATSGAITVGDFVMLAHGARVNGPAKLGRSAVIGEANAAFVGFNSLVDRATLQHDAMVLHLARVSPGIIIKTGKVVLSGKNITSQAQADDEALGKVIPITDALRAFMDGVLHVNETFAKEYSRLYYEAASNVTGMNYDPSDGGAIPSFNLYRDLPTFAGITVRDPSYRNRIIGAIRAADARSVFQNTGVVGSAISLRADEGEPFQLGKITAMKNNTTFHALEHTSIHTYDRVSYGVRSIVHGGSSAATVNNPQAETVIGSDARIGDYAVVFRSVIGNGSVIGCGSLIDGSTLAAGTVVPNRTIMINVGQSNPSTYAVEWNPGCKE